MKRTMIAALVGAALSTGALAQSSVTLSGRLDDGITYVTKEGGSSNTRMDSGVLFPNLWILSGHEDLGGGYSTVFKLSSLFNVNNGQLNQDNTLFGQQAWVGIQSPYGTISMGNQFDFSAEYFGQFNVGSAGSGYAIHQGDFDHTNNDRLKNSIKYMSPTLFGGLTFGGMYGFSNTPGSFHDNSGWSVGAQYANGPLTVAAAYTHVATPTIDPYAQIGVHSFFSQTVASVTGNTATDLAPAFQIRSLGTLGIGASYAIGDVTLFGNFSDTVLKYLDMTSVMHVYEGGATWQVTPAFELVGGYQHTGFEGHTWNQVTAAALYLLSKRTELYVSGDYLKASAGVDAVIGASFQPSLTGNQTDLRVGIYHSF
ncbi:porin [Paraburkholderia tagetis]|uniref:Porin n=1 Tax=Paraburkholderia tagetis TaxID=2913261 RepID=A0A9X1UMK6_9BURK|nr:porin [Paraburkholderia tagetis]MCG5078175.1 porin [Paraburkholderia tagetis]